MAGYAAYAMQYVSVKDTEIPMKILQWTWNPESNATWTQAWLDHLYNSLFKIDELVPHGNKYILSIVTQASPVAETYTSLIKSSLRGDFRTFPKTNALPSDAEVLVQIERTSLIDLEDKTTIEEAVEWVLTQLNKQ